MVRGGTEEPPVRLPGPRAGNMLLDGQTLPGRVLAARAAGPVRQTASQWWYGVSDWRGDIGESSRRERAPGMQTGTR